MSSANINNDDVATLSTKTEVEKSKPGDNGTPITAVPAPERGTGFWLVFVAICLALFVSALDAVRFATAGPPRWADLLML